VFANLDDRFFSEWLYFCDDCHAKARADSREVAGLIHGPMEWIGDREEMLDGARDEGRRALPAWFHR